MSTKKAFRCKNCGFLHTSDHAAEAAHPNACSICGEGVSFHPKTGVKSVDPQNWEVLAEATPERLKELGLEPTDVENHVPWEPASPGQAMSTSQASRSAQQISVSASEGVRGEDKATS